MRRPSLLVAFALSCTACERCAPGLVGQGVSRLTMRNVGALTTLINEDQRCGFESAAVKGAVELSGEPGGRGAARWRVRGCVLDYGAAPWEQADCAGVVTRIAGRATLDAFRVIEGTLSGDPEQPVVPAGPDAVRVVIERAELDRFRVEVDDSDAALTMLTGAISATVAPRLAVSGDLGVCSVPSKNVRLSQVRYTDALVHVRTEDRAFDVPVARSDLEAVSGRVGADENTLAGAITVWEGEQLIPIAGDEDGLDPEYDPAKLEASYACTEGLASPVSFDCDGALYPKLAQGAARLTIRGFGTLADRLDKDTRCGFQSPAVLDAVSLDAPVGRLGSATLRVDRCALDFAPGTVAETSCDGSSKEISGRALVSATKRLRGRLTGDREEPVVPMSDDPAEVELTIHELTDLEVREHGTALLWKSGALEGRIVPRVAADAAKQGACGFETPIARFHDVRYPRASELVLRGGGAGFHTTVEAGSLSAQNGRWGEEENWLRGQLTLAGETHAIPVDPADPGLDPGYDRAGFDAAWQCGTLEQPARFDCAFAAPIAQGAAQLSVQLLGKLAQVVEADERCGFASAAVRSGAVITGELGRPGGQAVFSITRECELSFPEETVVATDCAGKRVFIRGKAFVRGTKTLSGYVSGDPAEPIVPTVRDPAVVELSARFEELSLWSDPGDNRLTAHAGRLSGRIQPRLAVDTKTGACSKVTPVAELSQLSWQDGQLLVQSEGKHFEVLVSASALAAVNGEKDGRENLLSGTLTMDGVDYTIPTSGAPLLDPAYSAPVFRDSFACLPDLRVPAGDAECDMQQVLADGAARLLVLTAGTISRMANTDEGCGFSARSVLTRPTQVVGDVGDPGSMEWAIAGCALAGPGGNTPLATDCLGRRTHAGGGFVLDAGRTVRGLRNEVRILIFLRFDSVIPDNHDAVDLRLDQVRFQDFWVEDVEPGATSPLRGLRLRAGTLSAAVHPIVGERASEPGRFDVATPIATITRLHAEAVPARILYAGKRFEVHIDSADLEAQNGVYRGAARRNHVSGQVVLDGRRFTVTENGLDVAYSQQDFDARYVCTEDLAGLVPSR